MERQGTLGFKKSEEAVSGGAPEPPGDPFLLVADAFGDLGLPVPSIYHRLPDGSKTLQEDLGDETFFSCLERQPGEEESLTERPWPFLSGFSLLSRRGPSPGCGIGPIPGS
jgi:hypothetical protein